MTGAALRAWAEIDLDALLSNLAVYRTAAPGAQVLGVVKSDAYGHGAVMVAETLRAAGVERFGVAAIEEAGELREAGFTEPIWHLGVSLPEEAEALVEWGITPTVTHPAQVATLARAARGLSAPFPVHLKLDTGMGRRGADLAETVALWRAVNTAGGLCVEGLCTHYATADLDLDFAREQFAEFERCRTDLRARGLTARLNHTANSAAALWLPEAAYDVIRPGISLYGIAAYELPAGLALQPVMSVKSRLCQIRELPAGHEVGYAHGHLLARPTRVGLVSIGYGDGWPWRLADCGVAVVRGRRVPYLGRVNMDLLQIDLNSVSEACVGDPVTLLGRDGEAGVDAVELARLAGLSEYTLPTCLTRRVTRRYLQAGRLVAERGLNGQLRRAEE